MAYRKSVFNGNAPGMGFMTRSLWPYVIALLLLIPVYQFTSGYLHAKFGSQQGRSVLLGEWVGVAQLQPLNGRHQPPSYDHGSGTIKIIFKPAMFSYLSKLKGKGEIMDAQGHRKTLETMKFMTPFAPAQGHVSVHTVGGEHDDALTGTLVCRFDHDTLTITDFTVPDMFITAVLHPGTDQDYEAQIQVLKNAPTAGAAGGADGKP